MVDAPKEDSRRNFGTTFRTRAKIASKITVLICRRTRTFVCTNLLTIQHRALYDASRSLKRHTESQAFYIIVFLLMKVTAKATIVLFEVSLEEFAWQNPFASPPEPPRRSLPWTSKLPQKKKSNPKSKPEQLLESSSRVGTSLSKSMDQGLETIRNVRDTMLKAKQYVQDLHSTRCDLPKQKRDAAKQATWFLK